MAANVWPVLGLAKALQTQTKDRFGFSRGAADRVGTLFKTDILFSFHSKWNFNKGTILQSRVVNHRQDIVVVKDDDLAHTY